MSLISEKFTSTRDSRVSQRFLVACPARIVSIFVDMEVNEARTNASKDAGSPWNCSQRPHCPVLPACLDPLPWRCHCCTPGAKTWCHDLRAGESARQCSHGAINRSGHRRQSLSGSQFHGRYYEQTHKNYKLTKSCSEV